ncbi:hypothetical protein BC629DRAFT_1443553 [Irpex lacteus]|nr:hypothetical protein BC629DRAFT_1443553 [Irpex lacteus]
MTKSLAILLLVAHEIWNSAAWRERTHVRGRPWEEPLYHVDGTPTMPQDEAEAVKQMFDAILDPGSIDSKGNKLNTPDNGRNVETPSSSYSIVMKKKKKKKPTVQKQETVYYLHAFRKGRNAWKAWVKRAFKGWKLRATIDAWARDEGVDCDSLVKRFKSRVLDDDAKVSLTSRGKSLLEAIFPDDAPGLRVGGDEWSAQAYLFADSILAMTLRRYERMAIAYGRKLQDELDELKTAHKIMDEAQGDVMMLTGTYLRIVKRVRVKLARHQLEDEEEIRATIERDVEELKKVLHYEGDLSNMTESSLELMKSYREAVKNLARPQQMTAVQAELDHMLSTPLDDTLPEPLEEFTDLPQVGSEVTGPYSTLSAEELLTTLGMPGKQIVGMTTERDSARVFNKWETTMESQAFWDHPPPGRLEATTLSWHQVVGVRAVV